MRYRSFGIPACVAGLALAAALLLPACGDDPLEPGEGEWKLWIAELVKGRVIAIPSVVGIPDATVVFRAGLRPDAFVTLGATTTNATGWFEMEAKDHHGEAGFWRFVVSREDIGDTDEDVTIHCQLEVFHGDFGHKDHRFEIRRRPLKTLPVLSEALRIDQVVGVGEGQ